MKQNTFQINGTGTHNRGAELMALSIARELRRADSDIRVAVDNRFGTYEERAMYQLRLVNDFSIRSPSRWIGELASDSFCDIVGLVNRSGISGVLDASGFAFSDQWGPEPARRLLRDMNRPWRRGQKLVFLPQAFGPFNIPEVADVARKLLTKADLVFARDGASYEAVRTLGVTEHLRLCPDFTQIVHGVAPDSMPVEGAFAAIVPNIRMIDKTSDESGDEYLNFLQSAIKSCKFVGLTPLIVLHDAVEDRKLLPRLFLRTGELPVFESANPLVLKGALGRARVVIGSRYHALVSSLSQGVPCIGAGWSHKYRWLFEDFGCPEQLVERLTDFAKVQQLVVEASNDEAAQALTQRIRRQADIQREKVEAMWSEVVACLGI